MTFLQHLVSTKPSRPEMSVTRSTKIIELAEAILSGTDRSRSFRLIATSVPPPGGTRGKREPQTILKTGERSIYFELGGERKFNRQIKWLG